MVRLLDYDFKDDIPFLIMDYLPNGTLRQRYREGTRLPLDDILSYVKQVADVLQYAHGKNLIHCGVKPENMLLGRNNAVLLSDFCLPLIVGSSYYQGKQGRSIRTVNYLAPEQIQGHPGPASDQYALGIVVYEWINGARPFDGSSPEIISKHLIVPPPPLREKNPGLPNAIEQVVLKALAKNPKGRFPSVQDFANALEQAYRLEPYLLPASNFHLPPPLPTESATGELLPPAQVAPALESLNTTGPIARTPAHLYPPSVSQSAPAPSASLPAPPPRAIPRPLAPNSLLAASQSEAWHQRKLSRRSVIVGLIGTAVVVGGGTAAFVWQHASQEPSGVQSAHPTPIPPPLGTTFVTYSYHTDAVKGVAWSPDGKCIASGSLDRTVRVWDSTTGKDVLPPYQGHSNGVKTVAWSPDGKLIASGGLDGTVQVWDATTGSHIYTYTGHAPQAVRSVVWSPDSTLIASGAEANTANTVQVWDATTGSHIFSYRHGGGVLAVAWSLDGTYIASGSWESDRTVQIWNVASRSRVFTYHNHTSDVRALAWSPDSKRIASGSYDKTVQILDALTGNNVVTCHVQSQVETVSWLPKGQRIASGSDDSIVRVWDAAHGSLVFLYTAHSSVIWTVAWSPDGTRIASGSGGGVPQKKDHTVQVWQAE